MKVNYRGLKHQKEKILKLWKQIAADYNKGMAIEDICKKYPNERTGKPRGFSSVYKALKYVSTH